MRLKIIPEVFDVCPPGFLEQLQTALNAAGQIYGVKFKSEIAPDEAFDANQRFWDWLLDRNGPKAD